MLMMFSCGNFCGKRFFFLLFNLKFVRQTGKICTASKIRIFMG